jgi:RND superfamily putative drug exporter
VRPATIVGLAFVLLMIAFRSILVPLTAVGGFLLTIGATLGALVAIIKSIGFALALGILIDAFIVRMTLLPALMALLGERAWWLPGRLDRRLPRVDVEGEQLAKRLAEAQPAAA